MTRSTALLLAVASVLRGEEPLENTGRPMRVAFECSAENEQAAGLSCSDDEPCPVFLELSAVEAVGNRIFLPGGIHSRTATLSSILLASEDAGKTWFEAHARIAQASLDQVQFIDYQTGWISGAMLLNSPRDPFLLLSGDGGKSWRRRPLYDDSRPGVIERFWFDSRTSGVLLVNARLDNRHELFETRTGGESWSVLESSTTPLPFPASKGPAAEGWRVRADAATHAYAIERLQNEGWHPVASFLIEIGECRQ